MQTRVILTSLFFLVCLVAEGIAYVGKFECKITEGWEAMKTTMESSTQAIFNLDVDQLTLGEPFSFAVKICGNCGEKPKRVTADAIMPAHQHGMNYTPTVVLDEKLNEYKVSDFLFHMPGLWEITVSAYQDENVTHFTKKITVN